MLIGIGMISGTRREQIMAGKSIIQRQGGPMVKIISRTIACLSLYLIHILFIYGGSLPNLGFSNADKHCNDFSLSSAFFAIGHSVRTGSGRIFLKPGKHPS